MNEYASITRADGDVPEHGHGPMTPSKEEVTDMTTNHGSPAWTPGLMPPDVPVEGLRYYPTMSEQEHGNHWRTVPVEVLTIEDAREGMVTVGYAGWVGDETHLYEIDLTPAAAEELALRLVRRAHDIRTREATDEAGTGDA